MKYRYHWAMITALLFTLSLAGAADAAEGDRPIAMSEVSRMIDKGSNPQQVLETMAERGVSFRMSKSAEKRLAKFGFTEAQLDLIKQIAAGEKVDLDGAAESPGAADAPEAQADRGDAVGEGEAKGDVKGEDAAEYPVGFPNPAGWHVSEQKRIERAIKAAGLNYQRIELSRCTLYCNAQRARTLAPMLRELEAAVKKRFPETISNAISPQSAHIVIVDGHTEWQQWLDACFDSYEQDRMKFSFGQGEDPRKQLADGGGYMLPACAVTNANVAKNDEAVARMAAYSFGHLMMGKAGGKEQPNGLQTGFGNHAEALIHKTPSVMVYSYEKRELGGANAWRDIVAQRFKDKEIARASAPWGYETATMKMEHYAEAWSLVSTLAEAPDKLGEAVTQVREGKKAMADAVRDAYGIEDRKLLEVWYRFVNR